MLFDYVAPSLDTTILGTGHLLFQLGQHPEQWDLVRTDPALIPRAIDEALRLESPVRAFTRLAVQDYEVDGTVIPAGDRVLVMYAAANRDERRYPDPDRFGVTRDAKTTWASATACTAAPAATSPSWRWNRSYGP